MKKIVALLTLVCLLSLTCLTAFADSSEELGYVHFIPTTIKVTNNEVQVCGYFVNLNKSESVSNFKDFKLSVYLDGEELVSGSFGTINSFTVSPLGVKYQSFTYSGNYGLNNGYYTCDDSFTAVWGGKCSVG